MKFVLYVDYRCEYKPMTAEYFPMEAKTIEDAIIEADAKHNSDTMYLIRIMTKTGRVEKVERDVKAQAFDAIMEKRSTKWVKYESRHKVKYYMAAFGNWFEIAWC